MLRLVYLLASFVASVCAKPAGFNFVAEGFEGPAPYDALESLTSLSTLADAGVNTVTLSFPWYISSPQSTGPIYPVDGGCPTGAPFNNASSPSNASIVTAIRAVRALGMAVVLRPIIDPHWSSSQRGDSTWRGEIGTNPPFSPAQWDAFFSAYAEWMLAWAALAEAEHVETLCIGAELESTEPQEAHWRALFSAVRAVFTGAVYYSSQSGADFAWWDESDVIAQDMYPQLTNATVNPDDVSVDDLVAAWGKYLQHFHDLGARHNKSVVLQETGICSVNKAGLYNVPYFFECYGLALDQAVQAKYYEAVFRAVYPLSWIGGVTFWKWSAQGGPADPTFFPLNKTAMDVVRKFLLTAT